MFQNLVIQSKNYVVIPAGFELQTFSIRHQHTTNEAIEHSKKKT